MNDPAKHPIRPASKPTPGQSTGQSPGQPSGQPYGKPGKPTDPSHAPHADRPDADTPRAGALRLGGSDIPAAALRFSFVASSGPGGQNVNKRRTRAELRVRLADLALTPEATARLAALAGPTGAGFVTDAGELIIECDEHRSQGRNKDEALDRLERLIRAALTRPKARKPTKVSKGAKRRRLDDKKRRSDVKRSRRPTDD